MAGRIGLCCCFVIQLLASVHANPADDVIVLVTDKTDDLSGNVYNINVTSQVVKRLKLFKCIRPVTIAYDDVADKIYWSDVVSKEIRSSRLDGSKEELFIDLRTASIVDGMTVDVQNRLLFYTDTGLNIIVKVFLSEKDLRSETLLDSDIDKPRDIIAYAKKRKIIWSDWQNWASIQMCDYDGEDRKTLVNVEIKWPNGIALEEQSETLYWCDAGTDKIESIKLDGTGRTTFFQEPNSHFYGITLFEKVLYLTDWNSSSVRLFYTNGTKKDEIQSNGFKRLTGIFVFRQSRCPNGTFGKDCRECGNCTAGDTCNKKYGFCAEGCNRGFQGPLFDRTWSWCNETCSCSDSDGNNFRLGCDRTWWEHHCKTTTSSSTTTTTTTTTSTSLSLEYGVSSEHGPILEIGHGNNLQTREIKVQQADKRTPIALLSFGFVSMAIIAGIASVYAIKYRHESKRLKTYDHLTFQRSHSTVTTTTHCNPDYISHDSRSAEYTCMYDVEAEENGCPDIVSNCMLEENEHIMRECETPIEFKELEARYVSVGSLSKALHFEP